MVRALKALGYRYVTLDLQGYRTGSLNEGLRAPSGFLARHNSELPNGLSTARSHRLSSAEQRARARR